MAGRWAGWPTLLALLLLLALLPQAQRAATQQAGEVEASWAWTSFSHSALMSAPGWPVPCRSMPAAASSRLECMAPLLD